MSKAGEKRKGGKKREKLQNLVKQKAKPMMIRKITPFFLPKPILIDCYRFSVNRIP